MTGGSSGPLDDGEHKGFSVKGLPEHVAGADATDRAGVAQGRPVKILAAGPKA